MNKLTMPELIALASATKPSVKADSSFYNDKQEKIWNATIDELFKRLAL